MAEKLKILIATGNPGKLEEIRQQMTGLDIEVLGLSDVQFEGKNLAEFDCEEPFDTTEENAMKKARFYGELSSMLTFAEDTAFFVDSLEGKPGVHAKRFFQEVGLKNEKDWNAEILRRMQGIPEEERGCYFETSGVLYDPDDLEAAQVFKGRVDGEITDKIVEGARVGVGYDAIFFYKPMGKTFAEMSTTEKDSVSHRGEVIRELKKYIEKYRESDEVSGEMSRAKRL